MTRNIGGEGGNGSAAPHRIQACGDGEGEEEGTAGPEGCTLHLLPQPVLLRARLADVVHRHGVLHEGADLDSKGAAQSGW